MCLLTFSSDNDGMDDGHEVFGLRAEGYSIRQIADALGLSKSTAHRMLTPAEDDELDLDEDDDDRELALLTAMDSGYEVTPPWRYLGMETVVTEIPGCDEPLVSEEPRVLDAHGRAVSALDRYRARQKLAEAEQYDEGDIIEADLARQIEADGF